MLTYRPAAASDSPLIQSLAQQTWPDAFAEILTPTQIDYMLEMMYAPAAINKQMQLGHIFLILLDDEAPIGYVSYQLNYLPETTKIHKLYVLPDQQGKGAGRFLIEQVAKIVKARHQKRLRLDVNYQNKAVGFYHYLGFETIERVDTDIGQGFLMEDYVMERQF